MKRVDTPALHAINVPCPDCRAEADKPCVGKQGEMKGTHRTRQCWAKELQERSSQSDSTARWLRLRIRQHNPPAKPLPCGSEAAYRRHVRRGEPIDELCLIAARQAWADRKQALRNNGNNHTEGN